MCGRYSLTQPVEAVRKWFPFKGQPNLAPRYNIAPTQSAPILVLGAEGVEMRLARWGLVPAFAKEIGTKPLINARSETVAEKPSFRAAFRKRRCIVPADGFYEWQTRGETLKTPYRITKADGSLMAIAGIYEVWKPPEGGEDLLSFALLTTDANRMIGEIHDRMPVILEGRSRDLWLEAKERDVGVLAALFAPSPERLLTAYPVSPRVNRVANDDASLIEPLSPKGGQMSLL